LSVVEQNVEPNNNTTLFKDYFTDYVNIFNTEKRNETSNKANRLEKTSNNSSVKFSFYNNISKFRETMKMKMI